MKPIFKGNKDFNKSAFLNWRVSNREDISNMLSLAESYLDASIELTKVCLNSNSDKKADGLIFAILNSMNHGIELYLKSMIWTLNKLLKKKEKFNKGHDISQLLNVLQENIKEYKGEDCLRYFDKTNKTLIEYIRELFKLIDGSKIDFTRYPTTKKDENHFYIKEINNIEIDLENLLKALIKIRNNIDERVSYFFYQELKEE